MVSVYQTTDDGLHVCPECDTEYEPNFDSKEEAKEHGNAEDIEQYIMGFCSTKCFNKYIS